MATLADLVYLPRPRRIRAGQDPFTPRHGMSISLPGDPAALLATARRLKETAARALGMDWPVRAGPPSRGAIGVTLRVTGDESRAQSYTLRIGSSGVEIAGRDAAGVFYGVVTLAQILEQCASAIPGGEIVDWPDFPVRGVMLDVSRDKVPTMETLRALVDTLAGMKINHLQLYTEHTFAYAAHREVWAEASPITGEEVMLLDACCRERFVELVPNQNSFGHMERWLVLPRYRDMAECPDGFEWPWGGRSETPFSLDPSHPGCLPFLEGLYDELLPHFSSGLFNVGCDETFDLGQGRSRQLCAERGRGRVYLDFLRKIHGLVSRRGRTMLYWGDIIMEHPELAPELPADAIALEWGYEASHPFEEHGARFRASGVPWWVCPGTSSWNSLAGRTDNCLGNLRSAARAGLAHGATGFVNTDWGDNGHWQVLPVSFLGFSAGAAVSWCQEANGENDFSRELDTLVFRDRAAVMGGLARDLGNAYARAGIRPHNESVLFQVLRHPGRSAPPEGLRPEMLAQTRQWIESVGARLDEARMQRGDAGLVHDEYAQTLRFLLYACDRASLLFDGDAAGSAGLGARLREIIGEHRRLWLRRNRIGGLSDSVKRLEALLPRPPG